MNFSRFTIIRDDDKIQDKVGGEGQQNTKYLLNLEKRNIESNSLLNVVDKKNGNTLSKQVDILDEIHILFSILYSLFKARRVY